MRGQSNNPVEPLLIDRAAAAELPSAEAVGEWTREKRVFVSSVMSELSEERYAVAAGIRAVGLRVVMFEEFGGRDADPEEAYLAEVEGSDVYIGILGRRYGKPLKSRYSATHAEYLHAETRFADGHLDFGGAGPGGTRAILPRRGSHFLCRP